MWMSQVRKPAGGAPLSCPFPTKAAAQKVAVRNTIVHALINRDFLDFFMNWHKHLQKLQVRTRLDLCAGAAQQATLILHRHKRPQCDGM